MEVARDAAGELQRAIRQHIEEPGATLYWRKLRDAGKKHATGVFDIPRETKF